MDQETPRQAQNSPDDEGPGSLRRPLLFRLSYGRLLGFSAGVGHA